MTFEYITNSSIQANIYNAVRNTTFIYKGCTWTISDRYTVVINYSVDFTITAAEFNQINRELFSLLLKQSVPESPLSIQQMLDDLLETEQHVRYTKNSRPALKALDDSMELYFDNINWVFRNQETVVNYSPSSYSNAQVLQNYYNAVFG